MSIPQFTELNGSARRVHGLYAFALALAAIPKFALVGTGSFARPLSRTSHAPTATIVGTVASRSDQQGLPYASVAVDEPGRTGQAANLHERFADSTGSFRISGLDPGIYRIRAREIGYAPIDTLVVIAPGVTVLQLGLAEVPHILPRVVVEGNRPWACERTGLPDSSTSPELVEVFRALTTNTDRFRLLRQVYPFLYAIERTRMEVTGGAHRVRDVDTIAFDSRRWKSYVPGHLFTFYPSPTGIGEELYVPSVQDLGDSTFMATHCYRYGGAEVIAGDSTVRIDFRPQSKLSLPDFGGSIYLDAVRGFVRRVVFRLTHGERAYPQIPQLVVTTTFREIAPNVQVFDRVESDQLIQPGGDVHDLEFQRFLTYRFVRGAPGADAPE